MIAARKVCSANGARKQDVAHKRNSLAQMNKDDMSGGVAWCVEHLERLLSHHDGVSVLKPAVWRERVERRKSEHLPLHGQLINPECIVPVRPFNGNTQTLSEALGLATVVYVSVGEENLLHASAQLTGVGL